MSTKQPVSRKYRNYALLVLLLAYAVSIVDRSILSILLEPIKHDLALSDTQLGLLGGLAFAIFYATLGIPIAALADRWSRVKILAISMMVWSAMTALCGMASNFGLLLLVSLGTGTWNAVFLIRSHDMSLTEVGSWLAIISGTGAIGTFAGGFLADKLADRSGDRRWYLWMPGISTLVMVPFQIVAYLYGGLWAVIPSFFILYILGGMYLGPSFAMTQGLGTLRMRAVASAILLFIGNIIGMGLGPYFVGVASDLLAPGYGIDSLRYALCLAALANIWAASHYFMGAKTLREDLEKTEMLNLQGEHGNVGTMLTR